MEKNKNKSYSILLLFSINTSKKTKNQKKTKKPQNRNLQPISILVAEGHMYWACRFLISSAIAFWVTHFIKAYK